MDLNRQKTYLQNRSELLNLKDEELIPKIIQDNDYISVIYEKHYGKFKDDFGRTYKNLDYDTIDYLVTEAILVLLDTIKKRGLSLLEPKEPNKARYTIASYLSGICRNKILNEINRTKKNLELNYDKDNYHNSVDLNKNTNHPEIIDINEEQEFIIDVDEKTGLMVQALNLMKAKGGKCHALIVLSLSKDYRYKIPELKKFFQYKSENVAKTQKYKCIQRLKTIYNNFQLI